MNDISYKREIIEGVANWYAKNEGDSSFILCSYEVSAYLEIGYHFHKLHIYNMGAEGFVFKGIEYQRPIYK